MRVFHGFRLSLRYTDAELLNLSMGIAPFTYR